MIGKPLVGCVTGGAGLRALLREVGIEKQLLAEQHFFALHGRIIRKGKGAEEGQYESGGKQFHRFLAVSDRHAFTRSVGGELHGGYDFNQYYGLL